MIRDDEAIPPNMRYRDPLDILIAMESRSCNGCCWEIIGLAWGEMVKTCAKIADDGKRHHHGKRCKDYREK
jgi:hypothetical protein